MRYILVSHDRERGPLTFQFLMFLTFGFSGRDLDVSLRYIAVVCDVAQPTSLFYCILSETTVSSRFVYIGTRVQFTRRNIICNLHRYYTVIYKLLRVNKMS